MGSNSAMASSALALSVSVVMTAFGSVPALAGRPLSASGAAFLELAVRCKSASDLVNTVLCTGMTTKEGVSVLERLLLTCIAHVFEVSSCLGTTLNLSCLE